MAPPQAPSQPQTIHLLDACIIHAQLSGPPDAPLIIAQHGAPGASDHTESLTSYAFLADRYRVLVFDARGSGQSSQKGPFTTARWVADIEELRLWAGAETFILGGGSHGGAVALQYALLHGVRLKGLVLRDTFADGPALVKGIRDLALSSDQVDKERQIRLWDGKTQSNADYGSALTELGPVIAAGTDSNFKIEAKTEGAPAPPQLHHATHNEAFGVDLPMFDVTNDLHKIKVPTMVATGALDRLCQASFSQLINERIPNAKLVTFDRSGHSPPEDQPEEWQARLSSFLESCDA